MFFKLHLIIFKIKRKKILGDIYWLGLVVTSLLFHLLCKNNEISIFVYMTYEKVIAFKFLGSLLTNQNFIQEEIKCRIKAGNLCYYSVQTLLRSRLLSKNLKIKIYKTIIWPVVLYGCETWSLTLREEYKLRVFENMGPKGMTMGSGEDSTMRNFIICAVHLI